MEEKVLIKSEIDKKVKNFLKWGPLVFFSIAALISILLSFEYAFEYTRYRYGEYEYYTRDVLGWEYVFEFDRYTIFFVMFIIGSLSLLIAIVTEIIYLINRNSELCITENNVKGKTIFGKEVVLPLYMVSAYSTRKFLSTIAIATSSGVTKFALIGNYAEIGNVLSKKINERQENTTTESKTTAPQNNSMDDIIKLKSMLDSGIITQEEFDAKKKQLLGL